MSESNRLLQEMVARAKAFATAHPQHDGESYANYVCRMRAISEAAEVQLEMECEDCDAISADI